MRGDLLEPLEERRVNRRGFIRLGAILGLGPVAASILTACGGGESSAENGGGKAVGGSVAGGGPKIGKGQAIAKQSEVAANTAFPFTDADTGQQSVLMHLENGEFVAYSAVCTHQACAVAYKDGKLACPCHGSVFDPEDGAAVLNGPADRPLPGVELEVREGKEDLA
jgi:Rieske Fe-S protein